MIGIVYLPPKSRSWNLEFSECFKIVKNYFKYLRDNGSMVNYVKHFYEIYTDIKYLCIYYIKCLQFPSVPFGAL